MINIKTLILSFKFASEGIIFALKHNQNLRIQFIAAIFVILISIYFHVNAFEKGILGITILLVMVTEMINTAIEEMVNFVVNEHKREAKIAKDVAAGMVLLTSIGSVIVGILIFVPYIVASLK
ncbi:MAG: diacylglycerol kinase family protein [Patescibacteria group bacterium]|nr:diacylglycerol kinase family protein [Patescibacteria group bacterium]